MTDMMKQLKKIGIVPVVVLENAEDALPLGEKLMECGLPCAEVTFRTAAAADVIKNMTEAYPEILVGAGSIAHIVPNRRAVVHAGQLPLQVPLEHIVVVDALDKFGHYKRLFLSEIDQLVEVAQPPGHLAHRIHVAVEFVHDKGGVWRFSGCP